MATLHFDVAERPEHRPLALVEAADVQSERTSRRKSSAHGFGDLLQRVVGRDPPTHRGRVAFTGAALELIGVDPSAFGDDARYAPVRSGAGRGQDRVDVEDLPATDGLVTPALAQDVAVAGQQGQGRLEQQVYPDGAGRAGCQSLGAEDAEANRMLAGSDVGEVRTAPRDVVGEGAEHRERGIEPR